jgi:hypothetical protein
METNCDRRQSSTVSPQALMLMNSDFVLKQAKLMAERARRETSRDVALIPNVEFPATDQYWQYGYGHYDAATSRIADYKPLPHWTGSAWQGGAQLPDPALGWVLLNATGGHCGDAQHTAVRRWVASQSGTLAVHGKLQHSSENGDGVRGRIVSSRVGPQGEWLAKNGEVPTESLQINVESGDTIDFAVDCVENVNADSFQWNVELTLTNPAGAVLDKWSTATGFGGPPPASLAQQVITAWPMAFQRSITAEEYRLAGIFLAEQMSALRASGSTDASLDAMTSFCQQLLSANEFLYVD